MRKLYCCLVTVILCLWCCQSFAQCLSGTYQVGPGQTYTTLTAAINDYNKCLGGPVVFELTAPSYGTSETFPIQVNANADAGPSKTLTIRPAAGVTTTIFSSSSAIIKLNGADYITIDGSNNNSTTRNLTIQNMKDDGGPGACAGVWIGSLGAGAGATHNTIKNCIVRMNGRGVGYDYQPQFNNARTFYAIFAGSAAQLPILEGASGGGKGADNDQLTIQNNLVLRATHGIYVAGEAGALDDGLVVSDNTIGDAVYDTNSISLTGIHLFHCTGATINRNLVQNVNIYRYEDCSGMILDTGFVSSSVSNNKIIKVTQFPEPRANGSGGCGIDIRTATPASNLTLFNNMISGMDGEGQNSTDMKRAIVGIRITGLAGGIKLYFNSVFLNLGSFACWYGFSRSAAVYMGAQTSGIELRNNILMNNLVCNWGGDINKAYTIFSLAPASAITGMDYNDYYTEGTQGMLARVGATECVTLAAIQANFGGNQHSVNIKPMFAGVNDLHLPAASNAALDNLGTPIAGITVDIDGDNRNSSSPDIGADEIVACSLAVIPTPTVSAGGPSTFCTGDNVTLSSSAATGNQWYRDGTIITGATGQAYSTGVGGSYTVRATVNTCLSSPSAPLTVTVNAIPPTPSITQLAGTLTSSAATGNQWYKDGVAIAGATQASYITTASGSYTVKVTANGCSSALSSAVVVVITAVTQVTGGSVFLLMPNPVSDRLTVEYTGNNGLFKCILFDISGKKLNEYGPFSSVYEIDMRRYSAGIYVLDIIDTRKGRTERKMVVRR